MAAVSAAKKKPAAKSAAKKKDAQGQVDKAVAKSRDELDEIRENLKDQRDEVWKTSREARLVIKSDDDDGGELVLETEGGALYVATTGEVKLGRDGVGDLYRFASAAVQAVGV